MAATEFMTGNAIYARRRKKLPIEEARFGHLDH
jgi:hypothetical protein